MLISLENKTDDLEWVGNLQDILRPYCEGMTTIELNYLNDSARSYLSLGERWTVTPSDMLIEKLNALTVVSNVRMQY